MKLRTIRNTYTQEEQERNDALKAQYDRMMTHASRHLPDRDAAGGVH